MKRVVLIAIGLLALAVIASLCAEPEAAPDPIPELGEVEPPPIKLTEQRPFRLGFAYQPYDWSEEAFDATFEFIDEHGDLILHYIDEGVPWEQALTGAAFPADFVKDLDRRVRERRAGQMVVAVVNAVGVDRAQIASVWGEQNTLDFSSIGKGKTRWAGRPLDDPEVIRAFGNYCERVIDRVKPDYFFYSGEVNASFLSPDEPKYKAFRALAGAIYRRLKARYPDLPVGLEFVLADDDYMKTREQVTRDLMAVTDVIGVSTYPYVPEAAPAVLGDASKVPADWFRRLRSYAPDKPIGIVETGFNGAPVSYWDRSIPGNPSSQDAFVRFMLNEAAAMKFAFVAWWVHRDYDLLWKKLRAGGADDAFNQWRTTGLLDGGGAPRPALATWDRWLAVPQARTEAGSLR